MRISQPEIRALFAGTRFLEGREEIAIKYIYDGLTFKMGWAPIRKKPQRDKIKKEFHEMGGNSELAKEAVEILVQHLKTSKRMNQTVLNVR